MQSKPIIRSLGEAIAGLDTSVANRHVYPTIGGTLTVCLPFWDVWTVLIHVVNGSMGILSVNDGTPIIIFNGGFELLLASRIILFGLS